VIYDLLVVGGGINGAAVARDAALRGLRVLLVEEGDLAQGTSSRTSKLAHGGIRYLETGQLGLVREALRERDILLETAAPFVRPLPFLIPHYRGEGRPAWWIGVGLTLYAALAGRHRLPEHRRLDAAETLRIEPRLRSEGLTGGSLFWDAQMDDALLCVAIALDAAQAGAALRTYTSLVGLRPAPEGWRARLRETNGGGETEELAQWIVNAAGPWADTVRAMAHGAVPSSMRRTRGSHVVLPAVTGDHALLLTAKRDGRVFFVIPWGGRSLIGTTDVDDRIAPDRIAPASEDIRYLLTETGRVLPGAVRCRPVRVFAGLRSLARGRAAAAPWANPREHRILIERSMLTLVGGKYTTHRSLAERAVDRVVKMLGVRAAPCSTAERCVGAERARAIASLTAEYPGGIELGNGLALSEAEVVYAARNERPRHLTDLLLRRTRLWLDADALRGAAERAARWMAPALQWDIPRIEGETLALRAMLKEEEALIEEGTR
jgi:glycerol-3-phosphate dehydrogenase